MDAIARLVRTYARKVRSDARWSRATLPAFSSVSAGENRFGVCGVRRRRDRIVLRGSGSGAAGGVQSHVGVGSGVGARCASASVLVSRDLLPEALGIVREREWGRAGVGGGAQGPLCVSGAIPNRWAIFRIVVQGGGHAFSEAVDAVKKPRAGVGEARRAMEGEVGEAWESESKNRQRRRAVKSLGGDNKRRLLSIVIG